MKKSLVILATMLILAGCGSPNYAQRKQLNMHEAIDFGDNTWGEYKWSGKACYFITYGSNGHSTGPRFVQRLESVKSEADCKE